jgi:hypothetical protein
VKRLRVLKASDIGITMLAFIVICVDEYSVWLYRRYFSSCDDKKAPLYKSLSKKLVTSSGHFAHLLLL